MRASGTRVPWPPPEAHTPASRTGGFWRAGRVYWILKRLPPGAVPVRSWPLGRSSSAFPGFPSRRLAASASRGRLQHSRSVCVRFSAPGGDAAGSARSDRWHELRTRALPPKFEGQSLPGERTPYPRAQQRSVHTFRNATNAPRTAPVGSRFMTQWRRPDREKPPVRLAGVRASATASPGHHLKRTRPRDQPRNRHRPRR